MSSIGPRPQVVLDIVGVVVRFGGEELVGGVEVVDRELRRPFGAGPDGGHVPVVADLHDAGGHLQGLDRQADVPQPPRRADGRMACERQLGGGGEDPGVCGVRSGLRHIDEYRFAVTQFGGDALPVAGVHSARVDDAERIAELALRIGEHTQHGHVDGHAPDATTCRMGAGQVALRSSVPIASSTATRVSIDPVIAALADARAQQAAQQLLVVHRGFGRVDELFDDLDEAVWIVVEGEMSGAVEDLQLGAGHRGVRQLGVADRDHRVVRAPNQLHWN